MSKPNNLPENFFDKKDDLDKEFEKFSEEMATLQAKSDEVIRDKFEEFHRERNADEVNSQIDQLERLVEFKKRAEQLRNKQQTQDSSVNKFKQQNPSDEDDPKDSKEKDSGDNAADDDDDLEDKLLDWRSKGL